MDIFVELNIGENSNEITRLLSNASLTKSSINKYYFKISVEP